MPIYIKNFLGNEICVTTVTRLIDRKIFMIFLDRKLEKDTTILVNISNFNVEIPHNPGLFQQIPSKWEKDRAWILGSTFQENGAKSVFPCIDNNFGRASLKLCVRRPNALIVR